MSRVMSRDDVRDRALRELASARKDINTLKVMVRRTDNDPRNDFALQILRRNLQMAMDAIERSLEHVDTAAIIADEMALDPWGDAGSSDGGFEPLPTENTEWGFWGTWSRNDSGVGVENVWNAVFEFAKGFDSPVHVRTFLDARQGRHFADKVYDATFDAPSLDTAREYMANMTADDWKGWIDWHNRG